jgi:IS30 family transposase
MVPGRQALEEGAMLEKERWEQIRAMHVEQGKSIAEIARELELDRKTVHRCLRQGQWQPCRREAGGTRVLEAHVEYLCQRR